MSESTASYLRDLIVHFCLRPDLSSYDPYDIWKTWLGVRVKDLYNRYPKSSLLLAAPLALADDLVNNESRLFYRKSEYPIVRAMAAMSLLNLSRGAGNARLLVFANQHLSWLLANSCKGYSGLCWGLGFHYPVSSAVTYTPNTPLSTMTPYALEAFSMHANLTGDAQSRTAIYSIMSFFETDIQVMHEDAGQLATSYGPFRDRTVINASSYTMFAYALFLQHAPSDQAPRIEAKVRKLYAFIRGQQRNDGSWLYSPEGRSFIDCFHSCIVLKNIVKTAELIHLEGSAEAVSAGYEYLKTSLFDHDQFLFRRFSVKNKQGLVRFDLYDNAEALNLAMLLGDVAFAERLLGSIVDQFCRGLDVYSEIDFIGKLRNRNTLRWAVMPFLYAASQIVSN